jgi:glucokinase
MTRRIAVGIDLGGTDLKVGLVDDRGHLLRGDSHSTHLADGPNGLVQQMVSLVDTLIDGEGMERTDLAGVGIGSPGPLSPSQGRIHHAANLPGWKDIPLAAMLCDKLDMPVAVDNDANVAALAEAWIGAGRDVDSLALLTLGTGIGGGIIMGGKVFHGHFENAAELGHTIVEPLGVECTCGQRGCLERYASAAGVARMLTEAIQGGTECSLSQDVRAGREITSEDVVAAAKAGDAAALRVWNEACRYLAIACINIQHAINPALVVLGGGMSAAGSFLLDRVREHFDKMKWFLHDDYPAVVLARLGNEAGTIGAARLALDAAK